MLLELLAREMARCWEEARSRAISAVRGSRLRLADGGRAAGQAVQRTVWSALDTDLRPPDAAGRGGALRRRRKGRGRTARPGVRRGSGDGRARDAGRESGERHRCRGISDARAEGLARPDAVAPPATPCRPRQPLGAPAVAARLAASGRERGEAMGPSSSGTRLAGGRRTQRPRAEELNARALTR